jgi:hypothetical protein
MIGSYGQLVLVLVQRFYMVKPCPKEMKCDVEVNYLLVLDLNRTIPSMFVQYYFSFVIL